MMRWRVALAWCRRASGAKVCALNANADKAAGEHVHYHHNPVTAQEYRFAAKQVEAPEAVSDTSDN